MGMSKHTEAEDLTLEDLPPYVTIKQTAKLLGADETTIRRYIAQGRLTGFRVGPRSIRINSASITKLCKPIGCAA